MSVQSCDTSLDIEYLPLDPPSTAGTQLQITLLTPPPIYCVRDAVGYLHMLSCNVSQVIHPLGKGNKAVSSGAQHDTDTHTHQHLRVGISTRTLRSRGNFIFHGQQCGDDGLHEPRIPTASFRLRAYQVGPRSCQGITQGALTQDDCSRTKVKSAHPKANNRATLACIISIND